MFISFSENKLQMNKIVGFLLSMKFTIVFLILFFILVAIATFIENDYGSVAARAKIFNSKWFEVILLAGSINLVYNIFKRKLYRRNKLSLFLFHLSFIFIILGGSITRYFGYEGILHFRENETTNQFVTSDTYLKVEAGAGQNRTVSNKKVLFSEISNRYKTVLKTNNTKYTVRCIDFRPYIAYSVQPVINGKPIIHLIVPGKNGRQDLYIEDGKYIKTDSITISFNDSTQNSDLEIYSMPDMLYLRSKKEISVTDKNSWKEEAIPSNTLHVFKSKVLYNINGITVILKDYYKSAKLIPNSKEFRDNPEFNDTVKLLLTGNGKETIVSITGKNRNIGTPQNIIFDDIHFRFSFGSQIAQIPFYLKLNKFIIERYPGSNSPSSFESEVILIDYDNKIEKPYRIFMNNILKYKGYRFFQSSYDTDEKGSYLSVSYDSAGTKLTYFGYLLLVIGITLSLFNKNSRFVQLQKKIHQIQQKRKNLKAVIATLILIFISLTPIDAKEKSEVIQPDKIIQKKHAGQFGSLLVQDNGGRIKPLNTLGSEILRKVARNNSLYGLNSDQIMLGMLVYPDFWQKKPIIKISHPEIKSLLNIQGKYASFNDFWDPITNRYILEPYVNAAYQKKPAFRNKFDNYVMKVNERMNICYMVYTGQFLKIFPAENDTNNKWYSPQDAYLVITGEDSVFVRNILPLYLQILDSAIIENNWINADQYLSALHAYQEKYGAEIMPGQSKINLELIYNKVNIFERITSFYGLIGFILLVLQFASLLTIKNSFSKVIIAGKYIILLLFLAHFAGLVIRWYISGHAPWSNGYEALVYIAWIMVLVGLVLSRKSPITLSASVVMAYLIMHVAHLSWMDPEITPLVPVLKSYWLIIHVAVITASYSFLALGAILALVNLMIMFFETDKNRSGLFLTIQELTAIIEILLIPGLYLLTIGTFLGAVWANESWGRYWGWDPKESWALVTILVYAVIVHLRFIPVLKGIFIFNLSSLIGFGSVIMTYFGVNYYLSGLHSYAKGDPVPVPNFVYYTLVSVAIISVLAYINHIRYNRNIEIETE